MSLTWSSVKAVIAAGAETKLPVFVGASEWEIFEHQTRAYRDSVLPPKVTARVAVEQASTFGWERYVGTADHVIGMKTFGASAPLKELQKKFGFEPDHIVAVVKQQLGRK